MCKRMTALLPWLLLTLSGCHNDERLAQIATQTVQSQREQNQRTHESNQKLLETTREVTKQGREFAEAAKTLVEKDAEARREIIVAHREMRGELHVERTGIDQQRQALEDERRTIAEQRVTEPIIAEAIRAAALWIAALLPVGLAGYVLHSVNRSTDDQAAVNEVLVLDLNSEHPRLLPSRQTSPQIGHARPQPALPAPGPDDSNVPSL